MLGLLFMSLFGWVDLDLVYVNPTYLTSAIVGGVVMGAGFIMGGFCPGTSFCGAAIGKIDAMVFIVGLFIRCVRICIHYGMVGEDVFRQIPRRTKGKRDTGNDGRPLRTCCSSLQPLACLLLPNGQRKNSQEKNTNTLKLKYHESH
ncbi:MAG: YeeE/YedE family protein [Marinilabiliales bacterium]|nr:YeeE/YedE family protein [Marinilabiliales bacterium]